jgi:hypothetical protein
MSQKAIGEAVARIAQEVQETVKLRDQALNASSVGRCDCRCSIA